MLWNPDRDPIHMITNIKRIYCNKTFVKREEVCIDVRTADFLGFNASRIVRRGIQVLPLVETLIVPQRGEKVSIA